MEKWEFDFCEIHQERERWHALADSEAFTDEDRRQWRRRLWLYLVANHLTAEEAFLEMVGRVRASPDRASAALHEAQCFSPRGGGKGGRRALMAHVLQIAAAAKPGGEEGALQRPVLGAWTSNDRPSGSRAVRHLQERYLVRLFVGVRVLACRSAGRCIECDLTTKTAKTARPATAGDYCAEHRLDIDHAGLPSDERAHRAALRGRKARYQKATEHLFDEFAALAADAAPAPPTKDADPKTARPVKYVALGDVVPCQECDEPTVLRLIGGQPLALCDLHSDNNDAKRGGS